VVLRRVRAALDTPFAVALIAATLYLPFVVASLRTRGNDVSRFVIAGGNGVDASKVPPGLTVMPGSGGYDGVIFYRLALNPFTSEATAHGITIDNPSYRQQRVGYPLLIRIASLGFVRAIPTMMLALNVLAVLAIAAIGATIAHQLGHHAINGLLFALYPGFLLSMSRDTAEIVMVAFALAAFCAFNARRFLACGLLLTYAVLTRETALTIAIALAIAYVIERLLRRERRIAPIAFALPIATYAVWQLILAAQWGVLPLRAGVPATARPFSEYARFFAAALPRHDHLQRIYFAECVFLAVIVATAVAVAIRSRVGVEWRIAFLANLAIASTLPHSVWGEDFGFLRIFADLFLSAAILITGSRAPARWTALALTAGMWWFLANHVWRLS
jgi:hypothetical protein